MAANTTDSGDIALMDGSCGDGGGAVDFAATPTVPETNDK